MKAQGLIASSWNSLKAFLRRGVGHFTINIPAFDHRKIEGGKATTTDIVPITFGHDRRARRAAAARDRITRRRIAQHNDRLLRDLKKVSDTPEG